MDNNRNTEKVFNQMVIKEHYDEMSKSAEADFQKCYELVGECGSRLLNNEIFIIDNKTINDVEVIGKETSQKKIVELLDELHDEEDIRNSHIIIRQKSHNNAADEGFSIYYPQFRRADLQTIDVEIITGVSSFIEKVIYAKKEIGYRTFYRGHGNWEFRLEPGLYRKGREEILQHESEYIREIVASHPHYFSKCKTALDYLSILQHNSFPTRLLDFSENPLVALYMACSTEVDEHADVLKVSIPNECFKFYDSDTVAILSNLALFDDSLSVSCNSELKNFNLEDNIIRLVNQIRNEKPYFEAKIVPQDLQRIVFVKPKQSFDRISQQSGLFALFGIDKSKAKAPKIERMEPYSKITHYIIPSENKQNILEELSCLNITRASIYCDLENISKYYLEKVNHKTIDSIIERNEKIERKTIESIFN